MTVSASGTIDFVAHDPARDEALLVMVEDRTWGESGALLPELQAKFNTYLDYVTTGQIRQGYPDLGGKPVHIQLRSVEPPNAREREFLRIVAKKHLGPKGIRLSLRVIGGHGETAVEA